ncbi:hypothetical protein EON71_00060 [bacterium]|nr:MAG: hypothetical protein EON71_00060 [bacterium]
MVSDKFPLIYEIKYNVASEQCLLTDLKQKFQENNILLIKSDIGLEKINVHRIVRDENIINKPYLVIYYYQKKLDLINVCAVGYYTEDMPKNFRLSSLKTSITSTDDTTQIVENTETQHQNTDLESSMIMDVIYDKRNKKMNEMKNASYRLFYDRCNILCKILHNVHIPADIDYLCLEKIDDVYTIILWSVAKDNVILAKFKKLYMSLLHRLNQCTISKFVSSHVSDSYVPDNPYLYLSKIIDDNVTFILEENHPWQKMIIPNALCNLFHYTAGWINNISNMFYKTKIDHTKKYGESLVHI